MTDAAKLATACAALGAVDAVVGCINDGLEETDSRSRDGVTGLQERAFEVGSITKTFVAFLLARLVLEGTLRLEDPIGAFVDIDRPEIAEIKIVELATHTSGLPRLPPNLWENADRRDPYAHFRMPQMVEALSTATLERKEFSYSNFGFALLGIALARAAGSQLSDALRNFVFEPLGLMSTQLVIDSGLDGEVDGHDAAGEPTSHWNVTPETAGCCGVRSTAADLLRYASALSDDGLAAERSLMLAPRVEATEGRSIGLAWWLRDDLIWHTGGTGGSGALVGFNASRRRCVAILTSSPHEVWRPADVQALQFLTEGDVMTHVTG